MISALLRQDQAFRHLSPWLSMTVGVGTALIGLHSVVLYKAAASGGAPQMDLHYMISFAVIWLSMSVYLLSPGARTRATEFAAGLPLSARFTWTLHHAAVLLACLAAWAMLVGILAVGSRVVAALDAPDVFPVAHLVKLAVYLPAGITLAVALLQIPSPDQRQLRVSRSYAILWIAAVFGVLILMIAATRLPMAFAVVFPLAAVGVLLWNRQRAPLAFVMAPREAVADAAPSRSGEEAWAGAALPYRGLSYGWFLLRTIHRATARKTALPIIGYPTMLVLGVALSGLFAEKASEGALRYDLIIITAYMVVAFVGGLTENLHRVDALPLSRRRLLAILLLPPILTLMAGYGLGRVVNEGGSTADQIHVRTANCCGTAVVVPQSRCEIAWSGQVPDITAPWGESHPAWSTPLYRGSRAAVYSPYCSAEPGSLDFVALQVSRATQHVYGERIPEEEIASRYLETDAEGAVVPAAGGFTLAADRPGLRVRSEGPAFPIIMLLVLGPAFVLSAIYLTSFRAGISDSRRKRTFWILLMLLLAAHMAQYALVATRFVDGWVASGIFAIGIRKAGDAFPGSAALTWIVCATVVYLLYRLTARSFEKIEVTQKAQ